VRAEDRHACWCGVDIVVVVTKTAYSNASLRTAVLVVLHQLAMVEKLDNFTRISVCGKLEEEWEREIRRRKARQKEASKILAANHSSAGCWSSGHLKDGDSARPSRA
jgi:hypothetical protein